MLVPGGDGYAFRHALIREAVLGRVLPGEKTRLHIRLAEALAADPSLVPPGRAVIEQAHHWHAAHDLPRALASAWQAADAAGRSLAHAEKLAMLARILDLWGTLPDAARAHRRQPRAASWKPRRTPPWPRARTSPASGSRPPR